MNPSIPPALLALAGFVAFVVIWVALSLWSKSTGLAWSAAGTAGAAAVFRARGRR